MQSQSTWKCLKNIIINKKKIIINYFTFLINTFISSSHLTPPQTKNLRWKNFFKFFDRFYLFIIKIQKI